MEKESIYLDYYKNHYSNDIDTFVYYKGYERYLRKSLWDIIFSYNTNIRILDLGCWFWGTAYFFSAHNYKNYEGIDLSKDELDIARNNFPQYTFFHEDIFNYLERDEKKYDIIFMSMVFEHLTIDQDKKLIELIYKKLNTWGVFINYQPNADSYFNSVSSRYIDITHERLWNWNSYIQFVKSCCNISGYEVTFRNSYIGGNWFLHAVHKITKFFFEIFLLLMWYDKKSIYTKSFYSILKKVS